jgi:hypothetical protein
VRIECVSDEQATDGWDIDSRGYVPHAVLMRRSAGVPRRLRPDAFPPPEPRQASLPLQ